MKILAVYDDLWWEGDVISHIRYTSRVFIKNSENKYAFLKIVGEDLFGKRNHLESIGGGVEENETFLEAAQREVLEEMGAIAKNYTCLGAIIDRLNPIQRITFNTFFMADLKEMNLEVHRTEEEKILIDSILWLSVDEALEQLKKAISPVDAFVQRRDLTAFLELLKYVKSRT